MSKKGNPKPPIPRVCQHCDGDYIGFNGTKYCSDKCGFLANVEQKDECWLWTGYAPKTGRRAGYGEFDLKSGKRMLAHRASVVLLKGEEIDDMCVLHKCDTPKCVNPEHLFLGTRTENAADRDAKQRQARGTRNHSAKLTDDDVRAIRADPRGVRRLSKAYGVAQTTIGNIKRGTAWKHIDGG